MKEVVINIEDEQDIIEIINNTNNIKTRLYMLEDMYEATKNIEYLEEVRRICKNNNLCPSCFSELETKSYSEDRECRGTPCSEKFYVNYCRNCD